MNPIGLPATRQQAILTNCNDRYLIECRTIGGDVWTSTAGYREPMDSLTASRVAAELTVMSKRVVYRAYLVGAV